MVFGEKYDCIYTARGKGGDSVEELTHNIYVELGHYACFSSVYWELKKYTYSEVTYKVYLFKDNIEGKGFNLCTKLETKKILRCLQKTVPFSYKFEQGKYTLSTYNKEEKDFDILTIHIIGTYAQHLWVTTMLRCFFEWPYNIAAKEACVLQSEIKQVDDFDFTKENWINLYLTIAAQLGSYSLHGIVDFIGKHPKAKTYHEWSQKLASIKGNCRLIEKLREGGGYFNPQQSHRISISDQETLDQGTRSRASKYVAAYKDKLSWKN